MLRKRNDVRRGLSPCLFRYPNGGLLLLAYYPFRARRLRELFCR